MSMSERWAGVLRLRRILDTGRGNIHFVGVLGVSMSALALTLAERGFTVSGSDDAAPRGGGGSLLCGIDMASDPRRCIERADALVYSLAIGEGSVERRLAAACGVPEFTRAELLGALMLPYKYRIGVSGTHGKSTTTAMLATVLDRADYSPTVFCGAELPSGSTRMMGTGQYFVYEACEYRDAFLQFSPTCAIITNIELDHTDYFPNIGALTGSFIGSAETAERVLLPLDSEALMSVASAVGDRAVTYGVSSAATYSYRLISGRAEGCRFELSHMGRTLGEFSTRVPGEHNLKNAVAAAVAALEHGVEVDAVRRGLAGFTGIGRRLEHLGDLRGHAIYYDYAHHPTEIRASVSTLRAIHGSVAVIFRPHTYTRTRDLWCGFVETLSEADELGICDIFAAREPCADGISALSLVGAISGATLLEQSEAADFACRSRSAAVVLMGAGDLTRAKEDIERLIKKE